MTPEQEIVLIRLAEVAEAFGKLGKAITAFSVQVTPEFRQAIREEIANAARRKKGRAH